MYNPQSVNKPVLGFFSGLSAAAIWGGMYVVSKVVLEVVPPFSLITLRLVLGSLTLGLTLSWRGGIEIQPRQFWSVFGIGMIGYGISLGFQFIGTKLSTAANGSLVTSTTPAFILLFSWILLHEPITGRRLLALLTSTMGVLMIIDPRTARFDSALFWGNLSLVAAALTWALYSVLIRIVTRNLDVLTVSLMAFLGGLPIALPGSAWEVSSQGIGHISPAVVGGVLYLGVISTALAMYLWNTAFATLEAGLASLTFFAQPVVGTLLGMVFLNELITPAFIAGGLLIGLGLLIVQGEARAS